MNSDQSWRRKVKKRKMIAPIVISLLIAAYYIVFMIIWSMIALPWWAKLMGIFVPLAFMGALVAVLVERIKEIRSGDEDDLSQY